MASVRRKLVISAAVAALAACLAYLAGAWLIIYALKPEHPEISPAHLFREALSHLPVLVISFVTFQLMALALSMRAVARTGLTALLATVAEVSAVLALLHGLLSDLSAFDALWWQLLVVSAPVVIASTSGVVYLRQRYVHTTTASQCGPPSAGGETSDNEKQAAVGRPPSVT